MLDTPVTGKRQVARGMFVIGMHAPEIASAVRAGQFVNLGWSGGPLLRRPFSVYRAEGEHIEVVLKAVGSGTGQMLAMEVGDRLSCLGPLGRGFEFGGGAREAVLVSGGLGVAPMLGRTFSKAEDTPAGPETVILMAGYWRSKFGADPSVIGRRLTLDGRPRGTTLLAIDSVGAGIGERVLVVIEGRAAGDAVRRKAAPVDAAIIGIVDQLTIPPSR